MELSQFAVRTRCRAVVLEVIPGAVRRLDHGGDCTLEVGDGDCCVEDTDSDIVPDLFSSALIWFVGLPATMARDRYCSMSVRELTGSSERLLISERFGLYLRKR